MFDSVRQMVAAELGSQWQVDLVEGMDYQEEGDEVPLVAQHVSGKRYAFLVRHTFDKGRPNFAWALKDELGVQTGLDLLGARLRAEVPWLWDRDHASANLATLKKDCAMALLHEQHKATVRRRKAQRAARRINRR